MTSNPLVAVVTGASQGIGRGVARELARQGARVYSTVRALPAEISHDGITRIACDHRDERSVQVAFERILNEAGTVDVLVNNVWGGYERHTGRVLVAAALASEYGFTDIDGKAPRPLTLADV